MAFRPLILSLLGLSLTVFSFGADSTPVKMDLTGLINNSPFGTARSGAFGNGNAGSDPFEFRSYLEESNNKFFSIYETATRRSMWVELNDPVNGFSVKSYDKDKETITVDYQGKSMTLAIKRAPAVAQVIQQPMPQPGPTPIMPMPSNTTVQQGPSAIDQQRIQQIQEEIRRRRALRNQAMVPSVSNEGVQPHYGGGPQPQPSNSTGPQMIPPRN